MHKWVQRQEERVHLCPHLYDFYVSLNPTMNVTN